MAIPEVLKQISSPPKQLFTVGENLSTFLEYPRVAIVGSRLISPYGRQVTAQLATELAERGVIIVSGLAYGVDAVAHQATVQAGGRAIAVLPGPLDDIVPAGHKQLAEQIVLHGGALLSEYPNGSEIYKTNFVARNRLVAGISQAILITEAVEKSGSLHTARFALEQGKDVLAVPGMITSSSSVGTNNLIKAGATPVTSYKDVLHALGLIENLTSRGPRPKAKNSEEKVLLDLLDHGVTNGLELQKQCGFNAAVFNQTITMLELSGKIHNLGGNHWSL